MPETGCERCYGADAPVAWVALHARRVRWLVEESHFGVQVTACACGQPFVVVFAERIDWQGGEDAQDWLALPLAVEELATLSTREAELSAQLAKLARGRRFLVRSFPTGGALDTWWRDTGFAIGPHD